MTIKSLLPLAFFMLLLLVFLISLDRNPKTVPSALINQAAPQQVMPELLSAQPFSPKDMLGQRWLMNVWSSWCQACKQEHDDLVTLSSMTDVDIIGYNYKDKTELASKWLSQRDNPYLKTIEDTTGQFGLDWGIYGVPETFLIDEFGIIRGKHIGPIDQTVINTVILPFIRKEAE